MINSSKKIFSVLLVLVNLFVLYKALSNPIAEFDTGRLVEGMPALAKCLSGDKALCNEAPYFAPLQQLPALVLHLVGLGYDQILLLLVWLNTAFIFAAQIIFWRRYNKDHISVIAFLSLVILTGPILPYLTSSFSEAMVVALLAMAVFAFFNTSVAAVTGVLFFLISISKDTAPLWCIFLAFGLFFGLGIRNDSGAKQKLIAAVLGSVAGALVMVGFNLLRYESVFNTFHSQSMFMSESTQQSFSQLLALFISPNGGLLYFWLIPLLLILPASLSLKKTVPTKDAAFILGCSSIMIGGLLLSLSLFYSPFGWVAWGSRLALPWLFAVSLMLAVVAAEGCTSLKLRLPLAVKWLLGIFAGLWHLPHAFAALSPSIMMSVFKPTDICPGLVSVAADKALNTICMNEFMWPEGQSILFQSWSLSRLEVSDLGFYAASFVVCVMSVVLFLDDHLGNSDGI